MSNNQIRTTVVICPRESFDMFPQVAEQIYKLTSPIFKMLIMEGRSPEPIRAKLRAIEKAHPDTCKIVYSDKWLFPHEAVNQSMKLVDTEYVCYVDNDVEVQQGWLENLLKCAEEEKVNCVHPIYLTTKIDDPTPKIHVAEGKLIKQQYKGKLFVDSCMTYSGMPIEQYTDLRRKPSDFFEFHCVLFRKSMLDKIGPMDDLNIAEHIDYSLRMQKAGERIVMEPRAVVAYEYERIWRLRGADREYMLFRWGIDRSLKSLDRYKANWDLAPEAIQRRQFWVKEHTARVRSTYPIPKIINKIRRMMGMENMPFITEPRPELPKDLQDLLTQGESGYKLKK
jgi:cellulose synthase/poly-beta-1,6-N-acetylglucosamine synthase-like glycosyltransferase